MESAKWRTTFQRPRPGFGPGDTLIDFMDIGFQVIESGDVGTVSIPLNQYSAERAIAEIQPLADNMLAVSRIGKE